MQPHPPGPGLPLHAPSVKSCTKGRDAAVSVMRLHKGLKCGASFSPALNSSGTPGGTPGPHECHIRTLPFPIDNAASLQVIRRNFHDHAVARHDPDEVLSHLAGDVRHHLMTVLQLNSKLRIRESFDHITFDLDCFFLRHSEFFFRPFSVVTRSPHIAA